MTVPRLVVVGGSGFLGSQICVAATRKHWHITSLSRSGSPFSQPGSQVPPWASSVTWSKADIFDPSTYEDVLKDADAVVHSMGILLEADYKKGLQGRESPITGLRRAFTSRSDRGNPLDKVHGSISEPTPILKPKLTYESMNRDSAITLATAFSRLSTSSKKTFIYISASSGFPLLPSRYISTKRQAESAISELANTDKSLRPIFMRPGFMYSPDRAPTMPLSYVLGLSSAMNNVTKGALGGLLGAAGKKPLRVEVVGGACVKAIENEEVTGVVDVEDIEVLGTRVWREGML